MSKYAVAPSNAAPLSDPIGFVVEATPPTRISVSVTPGWSTFGNGWSGVLADADEADAAAATEVAKQRPTSTRIPPRPRIGHPPEHRGESSVLRTLTAAYA